MHACFELHMLVYRTIIGLIVMSKIHISFCCCFLCVFFLAFDLSVLRFFITATTANDLRLRRIFIPDFIHDFFYPILILEKEPVFPFFNVECQTRELLVPFL